MLKRQSSDSDRIGLIGNPKMRLSEIWQRMRFVVIFRLHGKGHKKFKCLQ
jgi:hypothetical protein